jgi:hypothetical protein
MKKILRVLAILLIIALILIPAVKLGMDYISVERHHFYCELISAGQTLNEVEEVLNRIGEYDLSEHGALEGRYYAHFKGNYIKRAIILGTLGELSLLFDESGKLIGVARNVGVSNWAAGSTCEAED